MSPRQPDVTVDEIAPVFPVRDVTAALEHYESLGFLVEGYTHDDADHPIYGFVCLGAVQLHLARFADLDTNANTSAAYLYVEDAQATYDRWSASGVERLQAPREMPYGILEFAHIDPDGNLLRVGSELDDGEE